MLTSNTSDSIRDGRNSCTPAASAPAGTQPETKTVSASKTTLMAKAIRSVLSSIKTGRVRTVSQEKRRLPVAADSHLHVISALMTVLFADCSFSLFTTSCRSICWFINPRFFFCCRWVDDDQCKTERVSCGDGLCCLWGIFRDQSQAHMCSLCSECLRVDRTVNRRLGFDVVIKIERQ